MAASREIHISDLQNEQERGKNFYIERQPDQTTHKRGYADVSTASHIYSTPDEDYKRGSEHKGPLETESAKNLVIVPRTMLALIVIAAVLSFMASATVLVLFVTIRMPRNLSDASTQTTEGKVPVMKVIYLLSAKSWQGAKLQDKFREQAVPIDFSII